MSIHKLNLLKAKRELLEIALIGSALERTKALDFWFKRHVRDYHIRSHISTEMIRHIGPEEFEKYHDYERRSMALKLADHMLKDNIFLEHEIVPSHQEKHEMRANGEYPWWLHERRFQMDLATFVYFY